MAKHIEFGKNGEKIAEEYLMKKGYRLLHRNWHHRNQELDLVMLDQNELVIVEVKSRHAAVQESMDEAISFRKIKFLVNATEAYINRFQFEYEIRFDVIHLVFKNENQYQLKHIKNAFTPPVD